jgi:pimeloyl-ACP methyl ester carboxylesterase
MSASFRTRMVENGNGLNMHLLEAGYESPNRPALLLLHGFPELGYSWRNVLPRLAAAGFYVIAPDQRGYGRTTGWDERYDGDVASFHLLNLVQDCLGLIASLGLESVAGVVGHDFGSPVAAWCALLHPEIFRSVMLMSAPFAGPPAVPRPGAGSPLLELGSALAALHPARKHYQAYYCSRSANTDMRDCPQGMQVFLRAYYHYKSADWPGNQPFALRSWAAEELAKMPHYYIMNIDEDMAQTVAPHAPEQGAAAMRRWLPEEELSVYVEEFARTGFQGGLQWYRNATSAEGIARLHQYAGRRIEVPCAYVAGSSDWGTYQNPGAAEAMRSTACSQFGGIHLVDGAGHWVQQEQPAALSRLLLKFFQGQA